MPQLNVTDVVYAGNGAVYTFSNGDSVNAVYEVRNGKLFYDGLTPQQESAVRRFNNAADSSTTLGIKGRSAGGGGVSDPFGQDTDGLVPGPTAADITGNYLLQADGDWVAPPASGGLNQHGSGTFTETGNGANIGGTTGTNGVIAATSAGSFAHGNADGASSVVRATDEGSAAFGMARAGGVLDSTGRGSMAFGYPYGSGAVITATDSGSLAFGQAGFGAYASTINSTGVGSIASGYCYGSSAAANITAAANGSLALGHINGAGYIYASETSSVAIGYISGTGRVRSGGKGSMAIGYSKGTGTTDGISITGGGGSIAMGYATGAGAHVSAQLKGGFAGGYAAAGEDIFSSANGAFQWAPGTNSVANSLQVGTTGSGIHLHADGAPGTPQNGDMWVANNNVYIRTGGATQNISSLT